MSRALVFIGRRSVLKFQQRRSEPFPFGSKALMPLLERLQAGCRLFQLCLLSGSGISLRDIPSLSFEFDLRSVARTFVLQLQLILTNHPLYQLVPRKHSFAGPFKFGGVLRSYLWPAAAGVHEDHFRSMFRI